MLQHSHVCSRILLLLSVQSIDDYCDFEIVAVATQRATQYNRLCNTLSWAWCALKWLYFSAIGLMLQYWCFFCCHRPSQRSHWCRNVLGWWTSTQPSDYSSTVSIQAFVTLRDTISLDEQRALLCLPFTCSLSRPLIQFTSSKYDCCVDSRQNWF